MVTDTRHVAPCLASAEDPSYPGGMFQTSEIGSTFRPCGFVLLEPKKSKQCTECLSPAMRALSVQGAALFAWSPVTHYPRRGRGDARPVI